MKSVRNSTSVLTETERKYIQTTNSYEAVRLSIYHCSTEHIEVVPAPKKKKFVVNLFFYGSLMFLEILFEFILIIVDKNIWVKPDNQSMQLQLLARSREVW